ncbi:MAG: aromatic amino acid transport family protein [Waddliaceae bacterium]
MKNTSTGSVLSAMLLIAGTCIGGGLLAFPLSTGIFGLAPSITMMAICWVAMTLSALFLLEVCLWMEEGAHMISMTERFLGLPGKIIAWVLYLFICYGSIVAYTAGGGLQLAGFAHISKELGCALFVLLFGVMIALGKGVVGRVNAWLFTAMIGSFLFLMSMAVDEINPENLLHGRWSGVQLTIPLIITAFSFQTLIPSLPSYLKRNARQLRWAVIGGTTLTFLINLIWQIVVLGIVPLKGENGLAAALSRGDLPITEYIAQNVDGIGVFYLAEFFAFFAMVTSFLGISLGLFDFLSDGLKVKEKGWGTALLIALIVIPTYFFAVQFEKIFLFALNSTGGIGDSILNGMIPVLMVWIGRYSYGYKSEFVIPGGRWLLSLTFLFFLMVLMTEVLSIAGYLPSIYHQDVIQEIHNIEVTANR